MYSLLMRRVQMSEMSFASDLTLHPPFPSTSINMAAEIQAPEGELPSRAVAAYSTIPTLTAPFIIDAAHRSYKHQYSNIYFVRLVELRPIVEERATEKWKDVRGRKFGRPANSKVNPHFFLAFSTSSADSCVTSSAPCTWIWSSSRMFLTILVEVYVPVVY